MEGERRLPNKNQFPTFLGRTVCRLASSPPMHSDAAKMRLKQWEDKWGRGAGEGKNRFMLHCSQGLYKVVGAPFS